MGPSIAHRRCSSRRARERRYFTHPWKRCSSNDHIPQHSSTAELRGRQSATQQHGSRFGSTECPPPVVILVLSYQRVQWPMMTFVPGEIWRSGRWLAVRKPSIRARLPPKRTPNSDGCRSQIQSHQAYATLWKSSIWRIQLVSGFHLGKIWATNSKSLILND